MAGVSLIYFVYQDSGMLQSGLLRASLVMVPAITSTYVNHAVATEPVNIDEVVITATREEKKSTDIPGDIDLISQREIAITAPAHPSEILNRSAGVHINHLGGEGHMTAIRQPITTKGVYLFLEDGLPTRPTGFFNHNALYEVNVPQAENIEVTKGPGSALYGSEAIGGIVNVFTRPAPHQAEAMLNPEVGAHGWSRLLVSGGAPINEDLGYRIDVNLTDAKGYRDDSAYSRYATTARFDGFWGDYTSYKTILSYSEIDQSGVSSLEENDYFNQPRKNLFQERVGARKVNALRLSTEFSHEPSDEALLTLTPFFRHNEMQLMPSWMVTYDPNERDYRFTSFGFLSKYRFNLSDYAAQWIIGLDFDYTPSRYIENEVAMQQSGEFYTGYQRSGNKHYDFDADQTSVSPYIHSEWKADEHWLISAGLRYDYFNIHYDDRLSTIPDARHRRPPSQSLSFDQFSPKLGAVYKINMENSAFVNMHQAFRAPSVNQLFRSGSAADTEKLQPVKAHSVEVGIKGRVADRWRYGLTAYAMRIKDDIVNVIDGSDRKSVNAGATEHRGIELSLGGELTKRLHTELAFSVTKQEYKKFSYVFSCFPPTCVPPVSETRDFGGYDVGKAPKTTGNLSLSYRPAILPNSEFEAEYVHFGEYYTDETNTTKYDGHDLVNLRANVQLGRQVATYARVLNIGDVRYSTYTSNQVGDPDISYRPGLPRSLFVGFRICL